MDGEQTWPDTGFRGFQVVIGLEVEPVLRRLVKSPSEQQGQLSRHRTRPLDHMRNPHRRHPEGARERRLGYAQLRQRFRQEGARMNGWQAFLGHGAVSSVVIHDLYVEYIAVLEPEAQAPLV